MAAIKRKKEDAATSSAAAKKSKTTSEKKDKLKSTKKVTQEDEVVEVVKPKKVKEVEVEIKKVPSSKDKRTKPLPKSKAAKKVVDKIANGDSSDEWSEDDDEEEMGGDVEMDDAAEDAAEGDELDMDGEGDVEMASEPAEPCMNLSKIPLSRLPLSSKLMTPNSSYWKVPGSPRNPKEACCGTKGCSPERRLGLSGQAHLGAGQAPEFTYGRTQGALDTAVCPH